ncbi:DUF1643 domain-containing protein [Photobacterium profundum]|uniref:DUF1643 domain-containing protein n=1 Tax=Photobacterium profundum (strain SS9) TaxID=298386 RepID=Q6LSI3_PHOPR|nr:DUF1643 domain-containing protein [Photobacterium profundum]CAG19743.1 hypothetical protein PBPRA1332 [Photobacterium profundum SS9]
MSTFATAKIGSSAPLPEQSVDSIVMERTVFNDDRTHRFTLFRHWGNLEDYACGISMNPSGAAEDVSDPTVNGMVRRAKKHWGVGAYYQLNVMSIRGTYSSDLAKTSVVNLPENDEWIRRIVANARIVVVSWGNPGHKSGRGAEIEKILRETCDPLKVFCFGKNKNGSPVHPLYQRIDKELVPYFEQ